MPGLRRNKPTSRTDVRSASSRGPALVAMLAALAPLAATIPARAAAEGRGSHLRADTLDLARKQSLTDAIFEGVVDGGGPGCAAGVVRQGDLVFSRGWGMANLDHGVPLDERSSFYLASVSKQFIGAAVGLLVLDGVVDLDDDVRRWIPEVPDYGPTVTIRHLLHHTSGIRDYLALYSIAGRSFQDFFDNDDALDMIARQKALNFEPGSEHLYSNSGYVLLAELVERASGTSLDAFSQTRIFGPLGMEDTHWGEDVSRVVPGRADSYELRDGAPHRFIWNFHAMGDGNLHSTIEDLARWDGMFYRDDSPWAELVELMLVPGRLNDGEELAYALGLSHGSYEGRPTVSHGGGMLGYRTYTLRFPDDGFTSLVLCNLASANTGQLARRMADVWLFEDEARGEPRTADDGGVGGPSPDTGPPAWSPTAEDLDRYVGTYYSEEVDAIQVLTREGSTLMNARGPRDEVLPLRPETPGRFAQGAGRLTFVEDGGRVTGFTLDMGRVQGLVFEKR